MDGDESTGGLIARTYALFIGAGVVGLLLTWLVGMVYGQMCSGGFECLAGFIWGGILGLVVALGLVLFLHRRLGIPRAVALLTLAGFVLLAVVAGRVESWAVALLVIALGVPALAVLLAGGGTLPTAPGRPRAWVLPLVTAVVLIALGSAFAVWREWSSESARVDSKVRTLTAERTALWGPADWEPSRWEGYLLIEDVVGEGLNYSYRTGGRRVAVEIRHEPGSVPPDGEVSDGGGVQGARPPATLLRRGDDVIQIAVTQDGKRLVEVERQLVTSFVRHDIAEAVRAE